MKQLSWKARTACALLAIGVAVILSTACEKKVPGAVSEADSIAAVAAAVKADSVRLAKAMLGREAFFGDCAMCHGPWGEGDGPLASRIQEEGGVAPAQLNDPVLIAKLGRDQIVDIITKGGARKHLSNMMPSWGEKLSPETIGHIADYVMALPEFKPGIPRSTMAEYLKAPPGVPDEGRKTFVFYCTLCHGPFGKGDGIMADTLYANYKVRPRNLTDSLYFAPKPDKEIFATVTLGGEFTGHSRYMPGWGGVRLTPTEIKNLVSYIRSISRTQPRP